MVKTSSLITNQVIQFFLSDIDPDDLAWFTEKDPEVMENRCLMSPEEFSAWCQDWLRDRNSRSLLQEYELKRQYKYYEEK